MNDRLRDTILWTILAIFAAFNVFNPLLQGTALFAVVPPVSVLSMLTFAVLHGPRQMGSRRFWLFFAITFVVSWSYESLSIATGFPFGHYHYTDRIGPKLGQVPLLIMPAYFSVCYVSWHLAHLLVDKLDQRVDALQTWVVPVLAAFITVMWDMSMDPVRSTIHETWIWHDGGGYMGVPFVNFMGWSLCVWTIFQLFALTLRRSAAAGVTGTEADRRANWRQMVALYGAISLEFVAQAMAPHAGTVTDPAGVVWRQQDIYESLGLVAIYSMVFVALLAAVKVQTTPRLPSEG